MVIFFFIAFFIYVLPIPLLKGEMITMENDIKSLLKECNELINDGREIKFNEDDFLNIKVEYDKNYQKNVIWVNPCEDKVMTFIDLTALKDWLERNKEEQ